MDKRIEQTTAEIPQVKADITREQKMNKPIKVKIRLDFKGTGKPGRFLFGGKSQEKAAEDSREQQVALFRNVPMQGIYIEDIDLSIDVFTVFEDILNTEVAYAPVILTIQADSLEDVIPFITKEEFRKIEIIEPHNFSLTKQDTERLFFKIHQQIKGHIQNLERKYLK